MKKIIKEHFDSIDKFLKAMDERPNNEAMSGEYSSTKTDDYNFSMTKNYSEAKELILNGYKDPLNEIKENVNFIGSNKEKGIKFENNVYGYIPNVPNAILGLPKSMIDIKQVKRKISVLDLIYCPVAPCVVDGEEFIKGGIKLLNVINTLEKNKIRVKLRIAVKCSYSNNEISLATIQFKNYNEQLNLLKLCFPMCHPAYLRRFGFKWLETSKEIKDNDWSYGYGKPITVNDTVYNQLKKTLNKQEKIIALKELENMSEEDLIEELLK